MGDSAKHTARGGCWKTVRLRHLVNGELAFRAYWRPSEWHAWRIVRNAGGEPIVYKERRFAERAAFELWRDSPEQLKERNRE